MSFCLGWNVCRRLNFYRREGVFFFVFGTVGSAWEMASSCCKLWSGLACAVCSMCLTLCGWVINVYYPPFFQRTDTGGLFQVN